MKIGKAVVLDRPGAAGCLPRRCVEPTQDPEYGSSVAINMAENTVIEEAPQQRDARRTIWGEYRKPI
jgi:hypothetical protein